MAESLRDQLLKSGLVKQMRDEKPRSSKSNKRRGRGSGKGGKPQQGGQQSGGEIDLARAYAMRARVDNEERRRVQREAEEKARLRKEQKRKLAEVLEGHALNKADAELMRHFEYGGKIRRVHVDAEQLQAINRGEIGVIQQRGRYLLVERSRAEAIHAFAPEHVALLVNPDEQPSEDDVPDDLVW